MINLGRNPSHTYETLPGASNITWIWNLLSDDHESHDHLIHIKLQQPLVSPISETQRPPVPDILDFWISNYLSHNIVET